MDDLRLQVVGWWRALFALWVGEAFFCQGQVYQARALFKAVLITSQEAEYRHLAGIAERCLDASLMAEEPVAATEHLEVALYILEGVEARNEVAKTLVAQAHHRQTTGDVSGARCLLRTCPGAARNAQYTR